MKKLCLALVFTAVLGSLISTPLLFAQGTTAFTYQGQLNDGGTNAYGVYTMIFALYDSASGGNQIGSAITNSPTLANGLFTVNLDFGAGAFSGNARWLDITVQSGSTSQELAPRVQVLPSPYALYANNAGAAGSVTNGSWSESVGTYHSSSNVFLIEANGSLAMAISTNKMRIEEDVVANGNLSVNSNFNVAGTLGFGTNNSSLMADGNGGIATSDGTFDLNFGDLSINSIYLNFGGGITGDGQGNVVIGGNGNGSAILGGNVTGAIPQLQVFNSSGTFVVPTNVTRIMVELWGGGGGGGGGGCGGTNGSGTGGGGGGGSAYAKDLIFVTPGSELSVTVGAGGGGGNGSSVSGVSAATGANGGTSSIGGINAQGGNGGGGGSTSDGGSVTEGFGGGGGGTGIGSGRISVTGQSGQSGGLNGASGATPNPGSGGNAAGGGGFGGGNGNISPGGGASGGFGSFNGGAGSAGQTGGSGRVIVWW